MVDWAPPLGFGDVNVPYREPSTTLRLVYTNFNGIVRAIDVASGRVRWQHATSEPEHALILHPTPDRLIILQGARVIALDAETGATVWSAAAGDRSDPTPRSGRIQVVGDTVLVGLGGILYALGHGDGKQRWTALVKDWAASE